jgi:hypothetical protein
MWMVRQESTRITNDMSSMGKMRCLPVAGCRIVDHSTESSTANLKANGSVRKTWMAATHVCANLEMKLNGSILRNEKRDAITHLALEKLSTGRDRIPRNG